FLRRARGGIQFDTFECRDRLHGLHVLLYSASLNSVVATVHCGHTHRSRSPIARSPERGSAWSVGGGPGALDHRFTWAIAFMSRVLKAPGEREIASLGVRIM